MAAQGDWIERLAAKWHEIPSSEQGRASSMDQRRMSDSEFLAWWDGYERAMTIAEGWILEVYKDFVRDKKLIEVGPGAGYLGVQLLRAGARTTFMDIAEPNLELIERICRLKGVHERASFLPIRSFDEPLKLSDDHDAVFAVGSLIHAPSDVAKVEFESLASRLKVGGRFLFLGYPKERWIKEGSQSFAAWGKATDGDATPWAEWYDVDKLLSQLRPTEFETIMAFNYHDDDFNWFDLKRKA
jgi:phospholipid N-methyltransferase